MKEVFIFEKNKVLGVATMSGIEYDIKETESHWKLISNGRVEVSFEWSKNDYEAFEDFISMLKKEGYLVKLEG